MLWGEPGEMVMNNDEREEAAMPDVKTSREEDSVLNQSINQPIISINQRNPRLLQKMTCTPHLHYIFIRHYSS